MSTIQSFHASARFGLGARGNELDEIGKDPRGWLVAQLANPIIPEEVKAREDSNDTLVDAADDAVKEDPKKIEKIILKSRPIYVEECGARVAAQIKSTQPFIERLVNFWSNHFTVSIQKHIILGIVNQYEVEAIRPHLSGYFHEMLIAVASHPAMLFYLDNVQSFGPNSRRGLLKSKGLNENLAREIMELHTLGVNGGYTQEDVIAFAKILTGWTIDRKMLAVSVNFKFQPQLHEPGDKVLLGRRFAESGQQEGIDALMMLAKHPATARHIATKLARQFIADEPPAAAVAAIEKTFLDTGGHLPSVMKTLIDREEAWQQPLAKLKNPYEFYISVNRLTGYVPQPKQALSALESLNYRLFNAPSPAGLDDLVVNWASPDGMMKRIEWAHRFSQMMPATANPLQLAQLALGPALSSTTRQTIERAASGKDGIALLWSSPEFQRR